MLRPCLISIFLISFALAEGQTKGPKNVKIRKSYPSKTDLAIGVGYTKSAVFLERNVKPGNDAAGISYYLLYGGAKLTRVSFEFTKYKPINIAPTWYDINAYTAEINIHTVARFQEWKAVFNPLFGFSYNHFEGFYTGRSDNLNLDLKYKRNSIVYNNWVGLNLGIGYEHHLGPFRPFVEYKMRAGLNKDRGYKPNIMDVCMGIGLRYNFRVPSVYAVINGDIRNNGVRSRYFLDKEDVE